MLLDDGIELFRVVKWGKKNLESGYVPRKIIYKKLGLKDLTLFVSLYEAYSVWQRKGKIAPR